MAVNGVFTCSGGFGLQFKKRMAKCQRVGAPFVAIQHLKNKCRVTWLIDTARYRINPHDATILDLARQWAIGRVSICSNGGSFYTKERRGAHTVANALFDLLVSVTSTKPIPRVEESRTLLGEFSSMLV